MKILETRHDLHNKWRDSVQVKIGGKWRTARKKFSTFRCPKCGQHDFEFVSIEESDKQLPDEEIRARFGIWWFFFLRESVLRHCKTCGAWECTGYGYTPPPGGDYCYNGWPTRQVVMHQSPQDGLGEEVDHGTLA